MRYKFRKQASHQPPILSLFPCHVLINVLLAHNNPDVFFLEKNLPTSLAIRPPLSLPPPPSASSYPSLRHIFSLPSLFSSLLLIFKKNWCSIFLRYSFIWKYWPRRKERRGPEEPSEEGRQGKKIFYYLFWVLRFFKSCYLFFICTDFCLINFACLQVAIFSSDN